MIFPYLTGNTSRLRYKDQSINALPQYNPSQDCKIVAHHVSRLLLRRYKTKQTPWSLVRERTIPTDRLPLVDEI
jgi:hypothetical protein